MRLDHQIYRLLFVLFCALGMQELYAQQIEMSGVLKDSSTQEPILAAVILAKTADSTIAPVGCISNESGKFSLTLTQGVYQIQISHLNYEMVQFPIVVADSSIQLDTLYLKDQMLDVVDVEAQQLAILQKGDTTIFNAGAFKTCINGSARDLVRKMPNLQIDGELKAQGEGVAEILVDGKSFGSHNKGDVLDNLPAVIVEKVEVYKYQPEEAKMSGVDAPSNQKTINIVTKKQYRASLFGEGQLSAGAVPHSKPIYFSALRLNYMKNKQRWNLRFESANLLGAEVERRTELLNPKNQLSTHFQDSWKQTSLNISYSFIHQHQNSNILKEKTFLFVDNLGKYSVENKTYTNLSFGHFANLQFRFFSKKHQFRVNASFRSTRGQKSNNQSVSILYPNRVVGRMTNREAVTSQIRWNYRLSMIYNFRFAKKGRGLTISTNTVNQEQEDSTKQLMANTLRSLAASHQSQKIEDLLQQHSLRTEVSYVEPLGQNSQFKIQANWNAKLHRQHKLNYNHYLSPNPVEQLDSLLSTISNQDDYTIQLAPTYQFNKKKVSIRLTNSFLWQELDFGDELNEASSHLNYFRIQPDFQFRQQLNKMAFYIFNYQLSIRPPTLKELQPVLGNANPARLYIGNPNLKQESTHQFSLSWNMNNIRRGETLYAQLQAQWQQNKIEQGVYIYPRDTTILGVTLNSGIQLLAPLNVQGSCNILTSVNWTKQLKFIPSNLNINWSSGFFQRPTFFNTKIQYSQQWNTALVVRWTSNISNNVDINISMGNNLISSHSDQSSNLIWQQNLVLQQYWSPFKRFFIQHYLEQQYTNSTKNMIINWNMGVGYNFFKKEQGELEVLVYNVLDQNSPQTITTTATYNEVMQNQNLLGRYFILKFTYHLHPIRLNTPREN